MGAFGPLLAFRSVEPREVVDVIPLDPTASVGRLAATDSASLRVFQRHGIEFCCAGPRTLAEACEARGLPVEQVIGEIRDARDHTEAVVGDPALVWRGQDPVGLIDHILARYHVPLDETLPQIEALVQKVFRSHGDRDGARLSALVEAVVEMKEELERHMWKEEQVLFPAIRRGWGHHARAAVEVMRMEHDSTLGWLRRIRTLTDEYRLPDTTCASWAALWTGLEALERELIEHLHLENNVLFPMVAGG